MNYSLFRAIKYAFKDFWRNIWLSVVTITVLVLALVSVNLLFTLRAVSDVFVETIKDKVDISVFFQPGIEQAKMDNFSARIKALPEVKELNFISKDEALKLFKARHQGEQKILEALDEVNGNPMLDAVVIKTYNLEDYQKLLSVLQLSENKEIIKEQNFTNYEQIIDRVRSISQKVENVGFGLTIVFSLIAILIVFNAIKVTIYTHKEEIAVMRLVGASNSFIRLPFIIESVLYAAVAAAIATGLMYLAAGAIGPHLSTFLEAYDFNLVAYYNQNFLIIFGLEFAAAVLLNIISCGLALGRYMKV